MQYNMEEDREEECVMNTNHLRTTQIRWVWDENAK